MISDDQLFYAMSRGLDAESAVALIVNGFAREVLKQLADGIRGPRRRSFWGSVLRGAWGDISASSSAYGFARTDWA